MVKMTMVPSLGRHVWLFKFCTVQVLLDLRTSGAEGQSVFHSVSCAHCQETTGLGRRTLTSE